MIQKRALKIIYQGCSYEEALSKAHLSTLKERRDLLTSNFFNKVKNKKDKLNYLLPKHDAYKYSVRHPKMFSLPTVRTQHFRKSFIPYSLFNLQY